MTLSREMRKDLNKWLLPRLLLPLLMVAVALLLVLNKQSATTAEVEETSHRIEQDTVRSELSDIDHRIKQEECLIRPFREMVQREPSTSARDVTQFCDPDEALPDLHARRDKLDERLREMGAYEARE